MKELKDMTVGEIVSHNIELAKVFQDRGIDFCCGGDVKLTDAARKANVALEQLVTELQEPKEAFASKAIDFDAWSLELLIDYIVKFHHNYIRENGPQVLALLNKVVNAHADKDPHLREVEELFKASLYDLHNHLDKEEQILFPLIGEIQFAHENGLEPVPSHCGSVQNPIRVMIEEHDNEGERFRVIAGLTNNYTAPSYACNSYRLLLAQLKEFEECLHIHIHVENNILFPKSIDMEKEVG